MAADFLLLARMLNYYPMAEDLIECSVCGGTSFVHRPVLWDLLVAQWQISSAERAYIDRQQGTSCSQCGSNLRSIALGNALRNSLHTQLTLQSFCASPEAKLISVLEINEAGSLSPVLRSLPGHLLAEYPAVDMHAMPYENERFDIVIHSDTLEHVSHPGRALEECRRVLKVGGWLCFTIPVIVGRLTRRRAGLEKSFHGDAQRSSDDFMVHTEFGADMWTTVLEAGFTAVRITTVDYPSALAMSAQKS